MSPFLPTTLNDLGVVLNKNQIKYASPIASETSVGEGADLQSLADEAKEFKRIALLSLGRTLIGLEEVIEQILIATVACGHVLLEGVPGTAKTTLCRTLATVMGLEFGRIQFTPDLLPSDVTGTKILDQTKSKFVLQTGPVFCQMLLADELNRSPARTQAALLEAMQENQVTIEGETLPLPNPFIVLATQNPVEQEGVYRLPEAQLDRFLFRVLVGYPDRNGEIELLDLQESDAPPVEVLSDTGRILRLQKAVPHVFGNPEMKEYVVDLIRESRQHRDVLLGASPRAGIFLLRAARARALLNGNVFFTHEDVQATIHSVLGHRLIIRPEAELSGRQVADVIDEIVRAVPVREG